MIADLDFTTLYAHDVLAGREVAGPFVRAQCERHLEDLKRTDIYFDIEAADYFCDFFRETLTLSEGQFEGRAFQLHISQMFIIRSIFGWKRKSDRKRRFRRVYIEEGKGNGKTPLAAGVGLAGLFADRERGAQIYSAASTKDQADICFQDAVRMVKANEWLSGVIRFAGKDHVSNMAVDHGPQINSFFRPVSSAVGRRGSGPRPHFVIIDELHEISSRSVIEILERGFKFREQPLILMITNSGFDKRSVCWEEREYAIRAAYGDPACDDTFAYICALDEKDNPLEDESCWKKANPLLDVILSREYLAGVVAQARAIPGRRNNILRLHFCVWTEAATAWITRKMWESLEDSSLRLENFKNQPVAIGLDLSARKDLSGRALVFPNGWKVDPETGFRKRCYAAFARGYTPRETLRQRAELDRADYSLWVEQGFLIATPGPVIQFPFIVKDIMQDQTEFDLQAVVYDKHLMTKFEEDMGECGASFPLIEHPQGWNKRPETPLWMPQSVDAFEDACLEGRIAFEVNPALHSAVSGATFLASESGLKRFDKARATQRIDLLIALVQAVGWWETSMPVQGDEGESVYEVLARQRPDEDREIVLHRRPSDWDEDEDDE